jgi:hypothetical protein
VLRAAWPGKRTWRSAAIDEKMRARGPRETSDHRGSPRIKHAINKVF